MQPIHAILKQYFGYDTFRSLQEDIINNVLQGNDTLALLPTGGGKSMCYQIPALAMEGVCIVVSPLVALMKDQTDQLVKMGIKAVSITSQLSYREIDIALDNCIFGDVKFLFVSPERLSSEIFTIRLANMNVCLFAIDEAHCISQWGYDFRPAYIDIALIREIHPKVPVLALTATATEDVIIDIQQKLKFKKENVLRKSFNRNNLIYYTIETEDKFNRLVNVCKKTQGSGLIYVRNRKATQQLAEELKRQGISAGYYHAGLTPQDRANMQDLWLHNKIRLMVCTNAFGMGINKPDVRWVVHYDLPATLEAYFQEAGRAGRDEQPAYAFTLFNNTDVLRLREFYLMSYPSLIDIRRVYQALGSYCKIAIEGGENTSHEFNIMELCNTFNLNPAMVYAAIRFLERDKYIAFNDAYFKPARVHINYSKTTLYDFQIRNKEYDYIIKGLLRNYSGILSEYVIINEQLMARKLNLRIDQITKPLTDMHNMGVLDYVPSSNTSSVTYLTPRYQSKDVTISYENYELRKLNEGKKIQTVIDYVSNNTVCRNIQLISYLGETLTTNCEKCDVCLTQKRESKLALSQKITALLSNETMTYSISTLCNEFSPHLHTQVVQLINQAIDDKKITLEFDTLKLCGND
ncbi:MAG: ATP-dependent DNA helicase RecQ [Bacteroidia bacterium]